MSATLHVSPQPHTTGFTFANTTLEKIPLSKIKENTESLRTVVDKQTPEYVEMVDSVRKRGIMNPILVRELKDPVSGETVYGLIDGLHRFNAAMDAGLSEIPAQIGSLTDGDLLEAQILANVHRIETKPVQYTKAIVKVMSANPLMTKAELCSRLSKSPAWLDQRLGLLDLEKKIQVLVDEGNIGLANAYQLAKLPEDKQLELATQAASMSPAEFIPMANAIAKEIATARRQGRTANTDDFVPYPHLRKLKDFEIEAKEFTAGSGRLRKLNADYNPTNNVDKVMQLAIDFAMHMDPVSQLEDKQAHDKRVAERKVAKEKAAAEKSEAKKKEAEAKLKEAGVPSAVA